MKSGQKIQIFDHVVYERPSDENEIIEETNGKLLSVDKILELIENLNLANEQKEDCSGKIRYIPVTIPQSQDPNEVLNIQIPISNAPELKPETNYDYETRFSVKSDDFDDF